MQKCASITKVDFLSSLVKIVISSVSLGQVKSTNTAKGKEGASASIPTNVISAPGKPRNFSPTHQKTVHFSVEISKETPHKLWLKMKYISEEFFMMETPWGGNGENSLLSEDGTRFLFDKDKSGCPSSVQHGQIPLVFYI